MKTINAMMSLASSKTFRAYYQEMRRHEEALAKIYSKDKLHRHVPEETGSVNRVHPDPCRIVTFYRCAICMKELTENEVRKLSKPKKGQ